MSTNETAFSNPANVVLVMEPSIPGEQNIFTYPQQLPALPQVGQQISIAVPGRGFRYVGKVSDVVFGMDIEDGTGLCRTTEVEIQCHLIDRQRLS